VTPGPAAAALEAPPPAHFRVPLEAAVAGPPRSRDLAVSRTAAEVALRIGVLAVLVFWCFTIARPFLVAVVWGVILAVAAHSGHRRLAAWLGGRSGLAAVLLTSLALLVLIGPTMMLGLSLVHNLTDLAARIAGGDLDIPPPPAGLAGWPLIGAKASALWQLASVDLADALRQLQPQLRPVVSGLLSLAAGAGLGLLQFLLAAVIAGLLLARSAACQRFAEMLVTRLAGDRGPALAALAGHTVRNVARGVIGTAIVQSSLAGLGFVVAGVPWAALLTLGCFLLCVVQIGPAIVLLGAIVYVFWKAGTFVGAIYLIWSILVALVDNVLKPLLMGRGSDVPLAVIFVGVVGGLFAHGLIGLFVGPVVLVLGYELFRAWLAGPDAAAVAQVRPRAAGPPAVSIETAP
jgi:predicted PurR-regulated permease PerM